MERGIHRCRHCRNRQPTAKKPAYGFGGRGGTGEYFMVTQQESLNVRLPLEPTTHPSHLPAVFLGEQLA
jgi:hypothetical protein